MTNDPTTAAAAVPDDTAEKSAAAIPAGGVPSAGAGPGAEPILAEPILAEPILADSLAVAPLSDYNDAGVPSLDFVRDKIEGRYGRSLGSTELAQETPEARSFQEQAAKREEAAHDRLEAIRRSLHGGTS